MILSFTMCVGCSVWAHLQRHGGRVLVHELDVDRPHHVIRDVVADVKVLHLSKLSKLFKDVLVEVLRGAGRGLRV